MPMRAAPRDPFVKKDRNHMDGTRFDRLIKSIATQRVSRLTALRGLAAGAVASVTGLSLLGEEGEAKKKGKKTRRRRICHKTSATDPGTTLRLKAKKAKKHLRNDPFDTKGACSGATNPVQGPPGPPGPAGAAGPGFPPCTTNADCPGNLCVEGRCLGGELCVDDGIRCHGAVGDFWCNRTESGELRCLLDTQGFGECDTGDPQTTYEGADGLECDQDCEDICGGDNQTALQCVLGACVLPFDSEACADCEGEELGGFCVELNVGTGGGCQST
jgi:hypothetical protein